MSAHILCEATQNSSFADLVLPSDSMTIGFIYPAYESYKALESKRTDAAAEWLTYWVIFSLFSVFESVADWLISWIPFYYILKLLFLLWLLLPRFKVRSSSSPSHDRHPQTHRLTPETRKHVRRSHLRRAPPSSTTDSSSLSSRSTRRR